jgi:Spy/CpxP family protein refolding chaperone
MQIQYITTLHQNPLLLVAHRLLHSVVKQTQQNHLNREGTTMKRLALLIMAGVLVASNAWAFRGGPGMGPGSGMGPGYGMGPCWTGALDLTQEQQAQIQARQAAFQKDAAPLRENLFAKKMELRNMWTRTNPEDAKVLAKQKEIQTLQTQLQEKATQFQLECRQMLTPEQQAKIPTTAAYRGGPGYHGGRGGGRGWGMQNW